MPYLLLVIQPISTFKSLMHPAGRDLFLIWFNPMFPKLLITKTFWVVMQHGPIYSHRFSGSSGNQLAMVGKSPDLGASVSLPVGQKDRHNPESLVLGTEWSTLVQGTMMGASQSPSFGACMLPQAKTWLGSPVEMT